MRSFNLIFIIVLAITFPLTSCNQKSKTDDKDIVLKENENDSLKKENELLNNEKEQDTNQKSEVIATDTPIVKTYRVIASFISKGEGPDAKTLASFESYLSTFEKKIDAIIDYDRYTWGKEGEADYCFYCKEMKDSEQKDFVTGLANLTKGAPLVILKENAFCTHKK
jgi:hypothetical protein